MKTKLLTDLRAEARGKLGVFKLSDGTYAVVWDKTLWNDVSGFSEKDWRLYDKDYLYQVVEIVKSYNEAVDVCDRCRRTYILNEVHKRRYGNSHRIY